MRWQGPTFEGLRLIGLCQRAGRTDVPCEHAKWKLFFLFINNTAGRQGQGINTTSWHLFAEWLQTRSRKIVLLNSRQRSGIIAFQPGEAPARNIQKVRKRSKSDSRLMVESLICTPPDLINLLFPRLPAKSCERIPRTGLAERLAVF